jgi:ribosomal protein S18 acetylase RimI-like enzyme
MKLTEQDKSWVKKIFIDNQEALNSDFDKAWEEGIFYGIPEVGFIRIKLGKTNSICELAIAKEYRHQGFGKKLLKYAMSPCLVATHIDNVEANRFYERNGFLHQGEAIASDGKLVNIYKKG